MGFAALTRTCNTRSTCAWLSNWQALRGSSGHAATPVANTEAIGPQAAMICRRRIQIIVVVPISRVSDLFLKLFRNRAIVLLKTAEHMGRDTPNCGGRRDDPLPGVCDSTARGRGFVLERREVPAGEIGDTQYPAHLVLVERRLKAVPAELAI